MAKNEKQKEKVEKEINYMFYELYTKRMSAEAAQEMKLGESASLLVKIYRVSKLKKNLNLMVKANLTKK